MKRPVVFDIDGVLADFYDGYWNECRKLEIPLPVIGRWDDFWNPKVWAAIEGSDTFWQHLQPLVPYKEMRRISQLREKRDVYFATSRKGQFPLAQTIQWLIRHGISHPSAIITHKKGEFCRAVNAEYLLDDKAGNVVYTQYHTENNTHAFLLDAPYNQFERDVLGSKVKRVPSVESFLDIVEA